MPELPEVETVARTLAPLVTGRTITAVHLLHPTVWEGAIAPEQLVGKTITGTGRRGKLLLVSLDVAECSAQCSSGTNASSITGIAFHLKMTGRLFVYPKGTEPLRHTRLVADLDDTNRLFFDDMRTFGYARALSVASLAAWPFWQSLGPEPLEISEDAFAGLFTGKKRGMKALLLDQTVLAGVGNIYADESLFRAGLHPEARGFDVAPCRLRALHGHLVGVLEESILACGSSIRDYRTARGDAGAFQNAFQVYGRAGKACVKCGRTLEQTKVAGRTTVWCGACQIETNT